MLDKIELDDIRPSSRKYPYVNFSMKREIGNDVLQVQDLGYTFEGEKLFSKLNFTLNKEDKIILLGDELAKSALLRVLSRGRRSRKKVPSVGVLQLLVLTSHLIMLSISKEVKLHLVDWLRQYSPDDESETFLRGFLGRMLFSGEEVKKKPSVLSGGEKVRCMLSKMMLSESNVLLLDEPTNHLDLESIQALNNGLIAFKGAMIFHIT